MEGELWQREQYRFAFNGMEQDDDAGGYTTLFRPYDEILGRWKAVDPLQKERSWVSSYNFGQNSPMSRVDPSGAIDDIFYNEKGEELKELRIKNNSRDRHFMKHSNGTYTRANVSFLQVNSKKSIVGDPRSVPFNGELVEDYTSQAIEKMLEEGLEDVDFPWEFVSESGHQGSLDWFVTFNSNKGALFNLNGIYYNDHEALNYMWGAAASRFAWQLETTVSGAQFFHIFSSMKHPDRHKEGPMFNEAEHEQAIIAGYVENSQWPSYIYQNFKLINYDYIRERIKPIVEK